MMKDQLYVYFVSFVCDKGFDSVEVKVEKEITNIEMIGGISRDIEETFDVQDVSILNYQLLRNE